MRITANNNHGRGFTLIELLVGIAVMALAVGFGIPAYQNATANAALRGATIDLVTAFNTARAEAVSNRKTIEVKPVNGDWSKGWLLDYDPATPDATQTAQLQHFKPRGTVTLKEANSRLAVDFRSDGIMVEAATGNITTLSFMICDGRDNEIGRTIAVNQFGKLTNTRHADSSTCN